MRGRLDGANLTLSAARDHGKTRFHSSPLELRIDFKIAEEFLGRRLLILAIERLQVRAGTQADLGDAARQFGSVAFAIRDGAGHGINHDVLGAGIVFGAVSVFDVQHVAQEFNESILESAAGTEERPIAAARKLNAFEHAVKTLIRAAGRGPQAVETLQLLLRTVPHERRRRDPLGYDLQFELVGG